MIYQEGSNYVTYSPVEAYGVSTFKAGIISGGTGDDNIVTQGVKFKWIYDPNDSAHSGFTGGGTWFCGVANTPLENITEETLLDEFAAGTRTNLNAEFEAWQLVVATQPEGADYVKDFMEKVGFGCFSING